MDRWEYRVVSLTDGRYTETLNEYGREGWELVGVASDVHVVPGRRTGQGRALPLPRALGKLEEVASKLDSSDEGDDAVPEEGTITTTLLWVLRRPLEELYEWDSAEYETTEFDATDYDAPEFENE
jgi:hypothetical protein